MAPPDDARPQPVTADDDTEIVESGTARMFLGDGGTVCPA